MKISYSFPFSPPPFLATLFFSFISFSSLPFIIPLPAFFFLFPSSLSSFLSFHYFSESLFACISRYLNHNKLTKLPENLLNSSYSVKLWVQIIFMMINFQIIVMTMKTLMDMIISHIIHVIYSCFYGYNKFWFFKKIISWLVRL